MSMYVACPLATFRLDMPFAVHRGCSLSAHISVCGEVVRKQYSCACELPVLPQGTNNLLPCQPTKIGVTSLQWLYNAGRVAANGVGFLALLCDRQCHLSAHVYTSKDIIYWATEQAGHWTSWVPLYEQYVCMLPWCTVTLAQQCVVLLVVVSTVFTLEAFHCTNDMHVTMVYCDLSSTMSHTVLLGRESFTWVPNTKKDLSQRNHIMPSPLASILTLEGTKNALNVTN